MARHRHAQEELGQAGDNFGARLAVPATREGITMECVPDWEEA